MKEEKDIGFYKEALLEAIDKTLKGFKYNIITSKDYEHVYKEYDLSRIGQTSHFRRHEVLPKLEFEMKYTNSNNIFNESISIFAKNWDVRGDNFITSDKVEGDLIEKTFLKTSNMIGMVRSFESKYKVQLYSNLILEVGKDVEKLFFHNYGSTGVLEKFFVKPSFRDYSSSDTINTFDDLMKEL